MVPQLHAKYKKKLMSQSTEKSHVVTNEHKNWTSLGLFGPLSDERELSQKNKSVLSTYGSSTSCKI